MVQRALRVPHAPAGVLALFNLRGVPVALLELGAILGLPGAAASDDRDPTALVLVAGQTIVSAIRVDRVVGVVPDGAAAIVPAERDHEHAAIIGFVTTTAYGAAAVLDSADLFRRLGRLRPGMGDRPASPALSLQELP